MVLQSKGRMSRLKYLTVLKSKIRRTSSLSSPSSSTSKTQPPRSDSPPISVYSKSSLPSDGLSQLRANDKLKTLVEERDEDHAKAKEEVKVVVVDDVKLKRESTEEHTSIKAKVIRSSAEAEHVTMIKDSLSDSQLRAKHGLKPLREERDEDHTKEEVAVDDLKREGTEDHTSIEAKVMRSSAEAVATIQESLSKIKESAMHEMMHDDVQTASKKSSKSAQDTAVPMIRSRSSRSSTYSEASKKSSKSAQDIAILMARSRSGSSTKLQILNNSTNVEEPEKAEVVPTEEESSASGQISKSKELTLTLTLTLSGSGSGIRIRSAKSPVTVRRSSSQSSSSESSSKSRSSSLGSSSKSESSSRGSSSESSSLGSSSESSSSGSSSEYSNWGSKSKSKGGKDRGGFLKFLRSLRIGSSAN